MSIETLTEEQSRNLQGLDYGFSERFAWVAYRCAASWQLNLA